MKQLNFTGRKKIFNNDVTVRLHGEHTDKPVVDVSAVLDEYAFPPNARIFLECQRQTRYMREEVARTAGIIEKRDINLHEFDDAESINFRLKVVDTGTGCLLGMAENIKAYDKNNKLSKNQLNILRVRSVDLASSGVLWRVIFEFEYSFLEIDKSLGNVERAVRSLFFKGFILPNAVQFILKKIVDDELVRDVTEDDLLDADDFHIKWLLFTKSLGVSIPDIQERGNSADYDDWIDEVVNAFVTRRGVRAEAADNFCEKLI